ncbi:MAG: dihydroorotase, partial [Wenzhouxiangella sp.]
MNRWLITNARLINEGTITETDIRVRGRNIERIEPGLRSMLGETVVDAAGRYLLPGMIDDHVHFREPGPTRKGNIATESRAAVAGGITSYLDMPNTSPPTTTRQALATKFSRASGRSTANYSFYLGATGDNLDEIRATRPGEACGLKVFMGPTPGNLRVDHPDTLAGIFEHSPLLVAAHCEDTATIEANHAAALRHYGREIPPHAHAEIHSREACLKASRLAMELARMYGTRLHVLHLSTAEEMALFEPGPVAEKRITGEACIHHLYFMEDDYAELGNRLKCNPSIKTAADRKALRRALRENRLDIIGTDHAPHLPAEKNGAYERAAAGLPLAQYALPAAWSLVASRMLTPEQLIEKIAHNPARRFGIEKRGFVREGYRADLVMIDDRRRSDVDRQPMLSQCGWTPFAGRRLPATVAAT